MKKISIQLKRLGKKKVKIIDYVLEVAPRTLQQLIESCVANEVRRYNEKREEVQLASFLTPKNIQEQLETGKVGFGEIENKMLAIEEKAIENALLAFQDGLYVVFINEEPIEDLLDTISIQENSSIAFIRMTFLTGTYW